MLIGAILAGATKSEQKIIEEAASEIGLAFQIQDDILDVTGNQEVLENRLAVMPKTKRQLMLHMRD